MRYLFVALIFMVGCNSDAGQPDQRDSNQEGTNCPPGEPQNHTQDPRFEKQPLDNLFIAANPPHGGTIIQTGLEDWYFQTHTNPDCVDVLKGPCRKGKVRYTEGLPVEGRITWTTFTINIVEYNMEEPPEWLIVWEMWSKLFDDTWSNHPIQTVKLINDNGQLKYCGFDNAWELELVESSEMGHLPDGSSHPLPENRNNGCANTRIGRNTKIDMYVYDDGRTRMYADNLLVFDKLHKTKKPGREVLLAWGPYWNLGYNKELSPEKDIILTINGFQRHTYTPK